jgi:hypothetical protein
MFFYSLRTILMVFILLIGAGNFPADAGGCSYGILQIATKGNHDTMTP